jgi:hypothetical protein
MLNRYRLAHVHTPDNLHMMVGHDNGLWVLFDDVVKLLKSKNAKPRCSLLEKVDDNHYHCKYNIIDITKNGEEKLYKGGL